MFRGPKLCTVQDYYTYPREKEYERKREKARAFLAACTLLWRGGWFEAILEKISRKALKMRDLATHPKHLVRDTSWDHETFKKKLGTTYVM